MFGDACFLLDRTSMDKNSNWGCQTKLLEWIEIYVLLKHSAVKKKKKKVSADETCHKTKSLNMQLTDRDFTVWSADTWIDLCHYVPGAAGVFPSHLQLIGCNIMRTCNCSQDLGWPPCLLLSLCFLKVCWGNYLVVSMWYYYQISPQYCFLFIISLFQKETIEQI